MSVQVRYYEHSGAVPFTGLLTMGAVGLAAACGLGWLYGVAIYWVPSVYIAFLLPLVLAVGIGVGTGWLARLGKVRSSAVCALVGLALGLVAEGVQWRAWLDSFLAPGQLAQLGGTLGALPAIASRGAWTVFDWTPTGGALWAIWGIEGLIVVAGAPVVAFGRIADLPFCERCEVWLDEPTTLSPFDTIHDTDRLKQEIDAGDFGALRAMEKIRPGADRYAALDLNSCPRCQQLRLVSVRNVSRKVEGNGREATDETPIVRNLIVDPSTWDALAKKV